jgi:spore germination protein YaaH
MFKKIITLSLSVILVTSSLLATFADAHWSDSLRTQLKTDGYVLTSDTLNVGENISKSDFVEILNRFDLGTAEDSTVLTGDITRIEALKHVVDQLGYSYLANQLNQSDVPFDDVYSDIGYLRLGLDFGIISENDARAFRPNDLLKTEEAIAMLYHVDRMMGLKISSLTSYYAISSYSQIANIKDLDTVIFGWSRLDYNSELNRIQLNTSSRNNNEYRIPSGYEEPVERAKYAGSDRLLMITVNDDYIEANTIVESIIDHPGYREQTIKAITDELAKDSNTIGFTGVLIDFEGLKGTENATALTSFVRLLRNTLDSSYSIAVAVHPVRKDGITYYDGYDYRALGDIADKIILMAHDFYPKKLTQSEMASGITITPLTPIQDIYYAIKGILDPVTGVRDSSKVVFQLSIDSVQWKLKDGKIINEKPYRPSYSAILSRINQDVTPQYSSELKSAFIIFQDPLDETRNVVWYEDERSVAAKIEMALRMGISDISIWRLGNIPSYTDYGTYLDIWDRIQSYRLLE